MPICNASEVSRRALLQGAAGFCLTAGAKAAPLLIGEIAPGLFVHRGPYEEATPENGGAIANSGFIVGGESVAVIDSGGSIGEGQALLAAIRQVTERPVAYVINTHFHPDHIFGNRVFKDAKIVAHRHMAAALAARGGYYLLRSQHDLGTAAEGLVIMPPDILVKDRLTLDLGRRPLHLQAWPTAHTDCDLTVRDGDSWFLGDLLFMRRMPTIDGSLRGWITVLNRLRGDKAARVIPGHGPETAPWPRASDALLRYLTGLARQVRRALTDGMALEEAMDRVGRNLREDWVLFDEVHPRNVAVAFAELEWE